MGRASSVDGPVIASSSNGDTFQKLPDSTRVRPARLRDTGYTARVFRSLNRSTPDSGECVPRRATRARPGRCLEAIARKRDGEITKSAATSGPKGLKAWQLRPSPIALGAIEIRRYCVIVYTPIRRGRGTEPHLPNLPIFPSLRIWSSLSGEPDGVSRELYLAA